MQDAWHFLNGTDLNFGLGNEPFAGIEDDLLLLMDNFGDPSDDPFAFGTWNNGMFGGGNNYGQT